MARLLLRIENLTKTHALNVYEDELHVEAKYPSQTITNRVKINDVADIGVSMDPTQRDPQHCMVTIKGKGRKSYEIPEMETYKARQLKTQLDYQRLELKRAATQGVKKESNFSAGLKNMPVIRKRF